jgi:hypothetical protein
MLFASFYGQQYASAIESSIILIGVVLKSAGVGMCVTEDEISQRPDRPRPTTEVEFEIKGVC